MRRRSFALLGPLSLAISALAPACTQTPVVVPLRSMERPRDIAFVCLEARKEGGWVGRSLEKCAIDNNARPTGGGAFRLHTVVSQVSRGELAVVDVGATSSESPTLLKVDPRIPGYSFLPTIAAPIAVAADPAGTAVYVASGREPRIDVLPAGSLRGPIDTTASSSDLSPWPHVDLDRSADGVPAALAVLREGDARRLYVTLPDAAGGPKIAVFALPPIAPDGTTQPVLPGRVGDIPLTAGPAPALPWKPVQCGPKTPTETWWAKYDRCAGETPAVPIGAVTVTDTGESLLAGTAFAGGKLFVADERAPFLHVFDVQNNRGVEIRRIAIGSPTSRVAVSPVVPDEVTIANSAAIDVCMARGWLGDGLDHTAESATVAKQLGGRCRAHRYIYAVDLVNTKDGSGSIAVVDVPVTFATDPATRAILLTKEGVPAEERLDFDGAELVQPMACDSPTLPARRLPVGPFAVNAANAVPARSVAFVTVDPPANQLAVPAARCRPFAADQHPLASPDLSAADGVSGEERAARIAAGEYWRAGVDPRRLRGVFAWVALENGAIVVVDVDDYDSVCRGPESATARGNLFLHPDETGVGQGAGTLDNEYYPRVVRRHHPRSLRAFTADIGPSTTAVTLSRFGASISNDPDTENGLEFPHFAALGAEPAAGERPPVVLPAPDNPYSLVSETWSATYEGALPGFAGAFGSLADVGGTIVLRDPSPGFCRKGVDTVGDVVVHDVVQLIDPICQFDTCTPAQAAGCLAKFGKEDALPLAKERSLLVERAFDDRLVIAPKHFERASATADATLQEGPPNLEDIKRCFGNGVVRYAIRTTGSWLVLGSSTGYLHRWMTDPASSEKACVIDKSKPRIINGRAGQLPPFAAKAPLTSKIVTEACERFVNTSWQFAIRGGHDGKGNPTPSRQDMRFVFGARFTWQPLSLAAGSLNTALVPVAATWDGKERLNWNMVAAVDAIDRGLILFPALFPFSFSRIVN
ncbi:MAG: hypothetical protein HYV09_28575 [Deltaproteobacteria bacterium]|nr:hypothetical protein [Deltaproteobacteria bacterium]